MKIICLGDSLTAGCGLRRGENWVELLREQTGDEWINAASAATRRRAFSSDCRRRCCRSGRTRCC